MIPIPELPKSDSSSSLLEMGEEKDEPITIEDSPELHSAAV